MNQINWDQINKDEEGGKISWREVGVFFSYYGEINEDTELNDIDMACICFPRGPWYDYECRNDTDVNNYMFEPFTEKVMVDSDGYWYTLDGVMLNDTEDSGSECDVKPNSLPITDTKFYKIYHKEVTDETI